MSVRATTWAWEFGHAGLVKGGQLLTLVRVADHADNNGVCWPGTESIADYTGNEEKTVRRHLKDLEDRSILHREREAAEKGRGRGKDRICLHLDQPDILSGNNSGLQPDIPGASTGHSGPVQPDISDPGLYREPSKEPKEPNICPDDQVQELFEFWKEMTGRNGSTILTSKRRRLLKARLDDPGRTLEEIKLAVANVAASDWHMKRGKHKSRDGQVQSDLTLICRDPEHLEGYRDMGSKDSVAVALRASLDRVETEPIEPSERAAEAWAATSKRIAASVPGTTYRIWIEPFGVLGERRGRLVLADLSGDDNPRAEWFRRRYTTLVAEALAGEGSVFTDIEVLDEPPPGLEREEG
ncbi:MAG TPA: helix-turn-helix domain-containing protein [Solirubrobacterales bacterium]|nr:helix-turn-helix domain-containing protein [Solirubrobacterales bacterium]